jgi:hypothetical protein
MKLKIIILIIFCGLQSCNAQKKNVNDTKQQKTMEPIVTKEFEKFDQTRYEKLKIKDKFNTTEYLSNGTYIEMDEGDYGKQYIETNVNCYFQINKSYYKNGNIKKKSLSFNWFAFGKGISYEFDEQGNLVKEIDYDKNYKFTFEDILKFCEKENILVEKGPILQSTGFHTSIRREFIEASKKATWTIERLKSTDRPNFVNRETITLDGTTGQVLSRTELPYVNN